MNGLHGLPSPDQYSVHKYWTDELQTHGRYVAILSLAWPYAHVDKIEIFEGEPDLLSKPLPGDEITDLRAGIEALRVRTGVARRLRSDILALRDRARAAAIPELVRRDVACELALAYESIGELSPEVPEDFDTILPLNRLHADIFSVQAKIWRAIDRGGADRLRREVLEGLVRLDRSIRQSRPSTQVWAPVEGRSR
jgi:hypothetical protein